MKSIKYLQMPFIIISNKLKFYNEIKNKENINEKIIAQLISIIIFFFIYGFIIGLSNSYIQALFSGLKLPILFILTLLVCFPTLYIFNILFGTYLSLGQYFAIVLSVLSVTGVMLLGFAPISLFFLITGKNYQFYKLLNVVLFTIAGLIGIIYLNMGINFIHSKIKIDNKARKLFIKIWILIYAFVGCQLAWALRPFFGDPRLQFELFRDFDGNFYFNIIKAFAEILGFK